MKIYVDTVHKLYVEESELAISCTVDADKTVKFEFGAGDNQRITPWLSKEMLLELRYLLNKALTLIS